MARLAFCHQSIDNRQCYENKNQRNSRIMSVKITFLGAADTVTGSKYLLEAEGKKVLVDAGLFQGDRNSRARNWDDPEVDLASIDAVLLTHAHIDHTGILPRYVKLGLNCPVYATEPTALLSNILLPDSAALQEEEAGFRREYGKSRHKPPKPLYRFRDAKQALKLYRSVKFSRRTQILPDVYATWRRMGHIIGAASIEVKIGGRKIIFSGDVGRYNIPILKDPKPLSFGDLLLIESTYGDRFHPDTDPAGKLARIVNEVVARKGVLLMPSFAVGRAQLLLYYFATLKLAGSIPDIPIVVDSPMAADATEIYLKCPDEYDEQALQLRSNPALAGFRTPKFTTAVADSKGLNNRRGPLVIISASGMLSGGRILHHLKHRISDERTTILFVGFQPKGGRGDWILSGAESLRLFGDEYLIKAHVEQISGLSAHADKNELLRWCQECKGVPRKVAVVHGEPSSAEAFKDTLHRKFSWNTFRPDYLGTYEI